MFPWAGAGMEGCHHQHAPCCCLHPSEQEQWGNRGRRRGKVGYSTLPIPPQQGTETKILMLFPSCWDSPFFFFFSNDSQCNRAMREQEVGEEQNELQQQIPFLKPPTRGSVWVGLRHSGQVWLPLSELPYGWLATCLQ